MSKSPITHANDKIATAALKSIFPVQWLFKDPRDADSGKEYGEDWVIEIVDEDDNVTGIEFGVQNKANPQLHRDSVSVTLKVSTVKYLIGLNRLVLVHGYHIDTKISYWIWLHDWYVDNPLAHWKNQQTVSISIPPHNILNEEAVRQIRSEATYHHDLQKKRKLAELVSRGSNWKVTISNEPDQAAHAITVVIEAKEESAVPVIRALDEIAEAEIIRATETGLPVKLSGRIQLTNVPEEFAEETGGLSEVMILPRVRNHQMPLRVDFMQGDDIIFSTNFVLMKMVQSGTRIKRWDGESSNIHYSIELDAQDQSVALSILFQNQAKEPNVLKPFYQTVDRLRSAEIIKLTFLANGAEIPLDARNILPPATEEEELTQQLVDALDTINNALAINLLTPDTFDRRSIRTAEFVAQAVREGIAPIDSNTVVPDGHQLIAQSTAPEIKTMLELFKEFGQFDLPLYSTKKPMRFELFGQTLELGPAIIEFHNVTLLNASELEGYFQSENVAPDTLLNAVIDIDKEQVKLRFLDWSDPE